MTTDNNAQPALIAAQADTLRNELDQALLPADDTADLTAQANTITAQLLQIDHNDAQARRQARDSVETMSQKVQAQAVHKSAMLKEPIRKLSQRSDDGGPVANALMDLKTRVEELDPARFDLSPGWFSRLLGRLPFVGTPVKRYFTRYESASTVIDSIVASLHEGREQLKRDNITLQDDQADMRELSTKLKRAIELGRLIDAELSAKLENEIPNDDPRYAFIEEELLFPLRQRIQDLQQQLAVNQQGVLTTEIIIRNNKELIRGVNRATSVTVNALQIAVTLALALANQKIVLDKIEAVNETTDNLIAGNARQLREQGTAIHQRAASSQLSMETLQTAFADINTALEDISRFRREALPTMAQNIAELDELAQRTEASISRIDQARQSSAAIEIEVA
ncbi:hypothetical protein CAI21_22060 [Alkalilimnicola ehrlichii]|uniref:Toxic anion resistance protein n=1 Tax=Alkalilimnicola ehrlichii TaxID=351052 RepID=A0A3E0WI69_9GAMM|nr:toxic anion resistance protein [Alkalilimnicola ehrlichii]RFA24338.1 hypothetical protein CAI21_22060 [Alkalilimnicola ehrlichii]RFA31565.1 hypothetical protein CAL65_22240 [Alkalilimnicola ehrlichii]